MLSSQRPLFDVPGDVCFLNAASCTPLPLRTADAARSGIERTSRPWTIEPSFASEQSRRARSAAARLINADPEDVAIIPSVGYGVAAAAKILPIPPGSRILVLQDDHSSPVLEWMTRATLGGFAVEIVRRPGNGDWTEALLTAIERTDADPISAVSISSVHWSDGGAVDLGPVTRAVRAHGAVLLVDATQSAGVTKLDVRTLDPDFVAFPTYKWLLGPYSRAFLYVAKRHQAGTPLEQTSYGRRAVQADRDVYFTDTGYVNGAQRFDMGERDHFISMETASIGMEMMAEWGSAAIVERLAMLTSRIADVLHGGNVDIPQAQFRAPHILSLAFHNGIPRGLIESLAAEKIYVARRLGRMRISPHVYNDERDIDRFIEAFHRLTRSR
jgi:selenocysteine lyase/cysteine desulfurase